MKNLVLRSLFSLAAIVSVNSFAIAKSQEAPSSQNSYSQTVTREVLASGYPADAPGYILELVRYIIPPGAILPIHTHPGMQIEKVESGTLTYTVVQGEAKVVRANQSEEIVKAGGEITLQPGDSLIEPGGMIHYGKNETANPIVLLSASLFKSDQPKAIIQPSPPSTKAKP